MDEIKVESRMRWVPCSDMVLGLCREHSGDLEQVEWKLTPVLLMTQSISLGRYVEACVYVLAYSCSRRAKKRARLQC